jgi:NADPH2:quinone reductase
VDLHELAELVDDGRLKPHVEEVFPLERAGDAHDRIEAGHTRGKLVLSVP